MAEQHLYDLIIVGAGPAGLSAGLYAGRATLDTLILEGDTVGGQVTTTSVVYNYPAVEKVDGTQLMNQMQSQVASFGVEIQHDAVEKFDLTGEVKTLIGKSGQKYTARSVIIATGANPKKVGFPGENEFRGRGIAYCSTCDGELFTGLQVFVVGGGYAAAEEADYLSRFAKHVTVLVRGDHFACPVLTAKRALDNPKVSVEYNTEVKEVSGDDYLTTATLVNNKTGEETVYHVDDGDQTFGMFIYIGTQPATKALANILDLDDRGYIMTDENGKTNIDGVYAAGDVIHKNLRQIVTAASDGAVASTAAERYIIMQKEKQGIPIHAETNKKPAKTVGQTSELSQQENTTPHEGNWLPAEIDPQHPANVLEGIGCFSEAVAFHGVIHHVSFAAAVGAVPEKIPHHLRVLPAMRADGEGGFVVGNLGGFQIIDEAEFNFRSQNFSRLHRRSLLYAALCSSIHATSCRRQRQNHPES